MKRDVDALQPCLSLPCLQYVEFGLHVLQVRQAIGARRGSPLNGRTFSGAWAISPRSLCVIALFYAFYFSELYAFRKECILPYPEAVLLLDDRQRKNQKTMNLKRPETLWRVKISMPSKVTRCVTLCPSLGGAVRTFSVGNLACCHVGESETCRTMTSLRMTAHWCVCQS